MPDANGCAATGVSTPYASKAATASANASAVGLSTRL
jgi:hypothetical protein